MGTVNSERVVQRRCSCGTMTDFRVLTLERGEEIPTHLRKMHNAPCGRPCIECSGVTMLDVINGRAHHNRRCQCLNTGRGFT